MMDCSCWLIMLAILNIQTVSRCRPLLFAMLPFAFNKQTVITAAPAPASTADQQSLLQQILLLVMDNHRLNLANDQLKQEIQQQGQVSFSNEAHQREVRECKRTIMSQEEQICVQRARVAQLEHENGRFRQENQAQVNRHQQTHTQLNRQMEMLRSDLTRQQQECLVLKSSLQDAPKLEELERWAGKVKDNEQKQAQLMRKTSELTQDLNHWRQRCRRAEHEHRQLHRVKVELEKALTEAKNNEDSMSIYFDRLTSYQNEINGLEEELRRVERARREDQRRYEERGGVLGEERDRAIRQYHMIQEQLESQKEIIRRLEGEIDKLNKQSSMQQMGMLDVKRELARVEGEKCKIMQEHKEERRKLETQHQSVRKESVRSERCMSQQSVAPNSLISNKAYMPNEAELASHQPILQQRREPVIAVQPHVTVSRPASRERLTSECSECQERLNTHTSQSLGRESSPFRQLDSGYRSGSLTRQQESIKSSILQEQFSMQLKVNEPPAQLQDQKKVLMEKLNTMRPSAGSTSRSERHLHAGLYAAKGRTLGGTAGRLQIGRSRVVPEKENLNDMIVKRYSRMMRK